MYTVYSKENCQYCEMAKKLLEANLQSYTEIRIGRDISVDEFKSKYPYERTAPLVLKDGQRIGGFRDLEEFLRVEAPVTMQTRI